MNAFSKTLRIAAVLLSLVGNAQANFHLWRTDQIYSSPDGKIQYIVMLALASGQEFISGHTITVQQGSTIHSFSFTKDLSGDTATTTGGYYGGGTTVGKMMLLATQGFANLGVVTPDFIIPDNFLFTSGGGSINWSGGYDIFNYTSIPLDGNMALFRAGVTATNAPANFMGQMGSIVASASPVNVQGLWWNSPANSESGWGINITQQGAIAFATWFTYDTDGSGMWIVMANGAQSTTNMNSYSGTLYRTTGPAFSSNPFDPTKVVATPVGTGTFTFTDGNNGTFAYTLNNVTQTKTIVRETFSTTVPTCAEGGTFGTNYQDLWWHAPANSESGWGINITHQGDVIFATWFTYDANGKGLWIVMANGAKTAPGVYGGTLYQTTGPAFNSVPFDPTKVVSTPVGTGTFTFTDASTGTFAYTLNNITQSKAIMREVFSTPTSVCN